MPVLPLPQGRKGAGSQPNSARVTPEEAAFSDDQHNVLAAAAAAAAAATGHGGGAGEDDEEVTSAQALAPEAAVADLKG